MLNRRVLPLLVAAALAGPAGAFALAGAQAAPAKTVARQARLNVGVQVLHFAAAGSKLSAKGLVTATLTDNRGRTSTVHTVVALAASTGGGCRVLHLFLNELSLQLLGLNAHLDKVTLDITGQAHGGVLGSLFCKLAKAKVASARVATLHRLNAQVRHSQGHVLHFTALLSPRATSSAANPTCQVLDLVVGPLNLQLLGLVVDLQRVHLSVTATRGAGALGDLFCQLADNNPTTSTTTTASTTT
jgi:hypothetical protein